MNWTERTVFPGGGETGGEARGSARQPALGGAGTPSGGAGAEGVVVGSALVNAVKESLDKKGKATSRTVKAVTTLVAELAKGVRGAKQKAP